MIDAPEPRRDRLALNVGQPSWGNCSLLLAGFETMHDAWESLTHGGLFSIVRESF
jgi:hypothetical protein